MKVVVYPADSHGCGHHRLIWVSEILKNQGHNVELVKPDERAVTLIVNNHDTVQDVRVADDVDVVVFQRVTHTYIGQAVKILRRKGIATVVDVDDDLTRIHPSNPAFDALHPRRYGKLKNGQRHLHSWNILTEACKNATLVTASTEALLPRYARHGRGIVLHNYLMDHYYDIPREDSDVIGWPASLHSHPTDPSAVGNSIARLLSQGATFRVFSKPDGIKKEFGITGAQEFEWINPIELYDWPKQIAKIGIGIAPLVDTKFNASKSWLKPLELAACGVPWVGSPRIEYKRLHNKGCGFLVDRPKDWYKTLKMLRSNPLMRADASEAGRNVAAQLKLRDHAWRWMEAWEEAVRLERS